MTREDLPRIVEEALRRLGGTATLVRVAQNIWENHEAELRASGDLFSRGSTTCVGLLSVCVTLTGLHMVATMVAMSGS